jgi:hypothetical protein
MHRPVLLRYSNFEIVNYAFSRVMKVHLPLAEKCYTTISNDDITCFLTTGYPSQAFDLLRAAVRDHFLVLGTSCFVKS